MIPKHLNASDYLNMLLSLKELIKKKGEDIPIEFQDVGLYLLPRFSHRSSEDIIEFLRYLLSNGFASYNPEKGFLFKKLPLIPEPIEHKPLYNIILSHEAYQRWVEVISTWYNVTRETGSYSPWDNGSYKKSRRTIQSTRRSGEALAPKHWTENI